MLHEFIITIVNPDIFIYSRFPAKLIYPFIKYTYYLFFYLSGRIIYYASINLNDFISGILLFTFKIYPLNQISPHKFFLIKQRSKQILQVYIHIFTYILLYYFFKLIQHYLIINKDIRRRDHTPSVKVKIIIRPHAG